MKSLNIDRGCHLLPVNDQHHVLKSLYHPSIISQIHFAWCQLHLVSRLLQHMFALLSSENFLRKWGSVSGSSDVMPSPGLGRHHSVHIAWIIYVTFPLVLLFSIFGCFPKLWNNSKNLKNVYEIIFFLSSNTNCQNGPGLSEAAEAGVCLVMARRHTSTHQVKKP